MPVPFELHRMNRQSLAASEEPGDSRTPDGVREWLAVDGLCFGLEHKSV